MMPADGVLPQAADPEEFKSLMQQCACVVCSSRDDPMPTFVTEVTLGKPSN